MHKSLHFINRDETLLVLGTFDRNLKAVREATGARIQVENNSVKVGGMRRAVERALAMLTKIRDIVAARGKLSEGDLEKVLAGEETDGAPVGVQPPPASVKRRAEYQPMSEGQRAYLELIDKNDIVISIGPAGTGKTFLAVAKGIDALRSGRVRRLILARPAVEAGERLGFLPGDVEQKVHPYLRPVYDALNYFLEFGQLSRLISNDVIEVVPLAYMRGRTLDEAFIILDEAQNTTSEQMKMFLTRMGQKSKIVVTGDITQIDLRRDLVSGLVEARDLLKGIPGIAFSFLTKADIVRHPLVQRIVEVYEQRRR